MTTRPAGSNSFATATLIGVGDTSVITQTADKTLEPGEPVGSQSSLARTSWWKLRVLETAYVIATTERSVRSRDFALVADTYMNLWSGTELTALTKIAGDDDAGFGATSKVSALLDPGDYYIQVGLYDSSTADADVILDIGTNSAPPPSRAAANLFAPGVPSAVIPNAPYTLTSAIGSESTTYRLTGPGQPAGTITDLMRVETAIQGGKQYRFSHTATGPWPIGGVSRTILLIRTVDAGGATLQSWNMPKAALSPYAADNPFYLGLVFEAAPTAVKFIVSSKMEMSPSGSGSGTRTDIWGMSAIALYDTDLDTGTPIPWEECSVDVDVGDPAWQTSPVRQSGSDPLDDTSDSTYIDLVAPPTGNADRVISSLSGGAGGGSLGVRINFKVRSTPDAGQAYQRLVWNLLWGNNLQYGVGGQIDIPAGIRSYSVDVSQAHVYGGNAWDPAVAAENIASGVAKLELFNNLVPGKGTIRVYQANIETVVSCVTAMPVARIGGRGDGRGPLGSAPRLDKMASTRQGLFRPGGVY